MRHTALIIVSIGFALPTYAADDEPWPFPEEGDLILPADAGHADVRLKYGAKGDGVTDDTAAIQKAISSNLDYHSRILYFPGGTYLISDTLMTKKPDGTPHFGMKMLGQSRSKVIIKLKDNCAGFQDPDKPKPMVIQCSRNAVSGNMAHWNNMINCTLDTGTGNPGAVGLDYLCSNIGSTYNVLIRSGDGRGVCGLSMMRNWPGPCLVKNVKIVGFEYAIRVRGPEYGVTFENIFIERQRVAGIGDSGNMLHIRKLHSRNIVPVFVDEAKRRHRKTQLTMLDCTFEGGSPATPALRANGPTYLRNCRASGYAGVLKGCGNHVGEYIHPKPLTAFPSPPTSLNLPVEETPVVPHDPPHMWARGGKRGRTQAAIDSGKTTVYIPYGEYRFDETIVIRGNVRRIIGMSANFWRGARLKETNQPLLRFEGRQPAVILEHFAGDAFAFASKSALVLRHCLGMRQIASVEGCGPLFIEDVCSGPWIFDNYQRIFARMLNTEREGYDIRNYGAALWILGYKTERPATVIDTRNGGYTEVLGGLIYPCKAVPADMPMFNCEESSVSFFLRQSSYVKDGINKEKLRETRQGQSRAVLDASDNLVAAFAKLPAIAKGDTMPAALLTAEQRAARTAHEAKPARVTPAARPALVLKDDMYMAMMSQVLFERVESEVAQGKRPRFFLNALRARATVVGVDGDSLMLHCGQTKTSWMWNRLSITDRKNLAVAMAAIGDSDDNATAAFFLLASSETRRAQDYLYESEERRAEIEEMFEVRAAGGRSPSARR